MELRQLRYFIKTAETLNFSEAARFLYVSQSTLSQQIKTLEEELGTVLFQRDSHSVTLTEAGEMMLPLAQATVHDAESCLTQIKDLNHLVSGSLSIGVTHSFSPILTETVKAFLKLYPGIKVNITNRSMEELMSILRRREVDLVLAFKPNISYEEIESHSLFEDKLCVILRRDNPIAEMQNITVDEVMRHRLCLPAKGLQARNMIERYINLEQPYGNVVLEVNEVSTLLDIVESSNTMTILSEATIRGRDNLTAIPLDVSDNQMQGCVHMLKKVYRKRSAEIFIAMLRDSLAVKELSGRWYK